MSVSRRDMLLAGLGLTLSGCAAATSRRQAPNPTSIWPSGAAAARGDNATPAAQPHYRAPRPRPAPAPAVNASGVIARSAWTRHGLASHNINAMNGISRITVHHEGWTPVYFTDARSTYARIEKIRQVHTRDRGWADIGYHFVIDRAGRVISGRNTRYQGAHVSEHNRHNVGILVLGNFERQRPSRAQLQSLGRFLQLAMRSYRVPLSRVHTHQELNPTKCPGRHLQANVNRMRRGGLA